MEGIAYFRFGWFDKHIRVVPMDWINYGTIKLPHIDGDWAYNKIGTFKCRDRYGYYTVYGFVPDHMVPHSYQPRTGAESDFAGMALWEDSVNMRTAISRLFDKPEYRHLADPLDSFQGER